jgi:HAL2 family 3'(2'),5'-bisphosphate nucleotidase
LNLCTREEMDAVTLNLLSVARAAVRAASRATTAIQKKEVVVFASKADASPVTTADYSAQAIVSSVLRAAVNKGEIPGPFRCVGEENSADLRTGKSGLLPAVVASVEAAHAGVAFAGRSRAWTEDAVCESIDAGAYDGDARNAYWVLDPVDGTKGFLRGASGQYAVGLAYVADGRPTVAAIACPNLPYPSWSAGHGATVGTLFSASRGKGAFMEPLTAPDMPGGEAESRVRISTSTVAEFSAAVFCESFDAGHSDHDA